MKAEEKANEKRRKSWHLHSRRRHMLRLEKGSRILFFFKSTFVCVHKGRRVNGLGPFGKENKEKQKESCVHTFPQNAEFNRKMPLYDSNIVLHLLLCDTWPTPRTLWQDAFQQRARTPPWWVVHNFLVPPKLLYPHGSNMPSIITCNWFFRSQKFKIQCPKVHPNFHT